MKNTLKNNYNYAFKYPLKEGALYNSPEQKDRGRE
jgi:hypothetical protein